MWEHQQTAPQSLFSFSFQRHQKSETRRRKRRMVKGTNQIITMLQFYLYLFFAFYILSWRRGRRMLRRARDLLGHLTGSPRLCVWGARWSDRDPPCLPNVATSSWFAPHPGLSAPRLPVQWSAASSAACVCKTHSVSGPSACLLRCCLLQKSAAAFCQSSLRPDCRQPQCSPCDEEVEKVFGDLIIDDEKTFFAATFYLSTLIRSVFNSAVFEIRRNFHQQK